jgi:5-methylcytosine-specific restriction endonuclease McrA
MRNFKYTEEIEKLRKKLNFPEEQMAVAVRARFCCEYCGKDLLESVDAYDSWQIDHIIPKNDEPANEHTDNLALSCKTCNFAKRHSKTELLLKGANRSEKIEEARKIVWERRAKKEITLMKVRELADLLLAFENEKTV